MSLDDLAAGPSGGVERVTAWHGKPQPGIQPREPGAASAGVPQRNAFMQMFRFCAVLLTRASALIAAGEGARPVSFVYSHIRN